MTDIKCSICKWEDETGRKVDTARSPEEWGKDVGVHRTSITRHLGHAPNIDRSSSRVAQIPTGESETHRPDGSADYVRFSKVPWGYRDYRDFIESTGQDPEDVTFTWGFTSSPNGGFWNKLLNVRPKAGVVLAEGIDPIDPHAILAQLRAQSMAPLPAKRMGYESEESSTFVLSINDVQLGQNYNGGSAATIAQFYQFVEGAVERIHELRSIGRNLDELVIICGGDLIEGCFIYPNQAMNVDMHRKQQMEGMIALVLHLIDRLSPMFTRVRVLAARGNHGENRVDGNRTTIGDNDDTHVIEMAKLALSRDPGSQHVDDWVIADTEDGVWMDVHGWTLVTTHGDIYAKGVAGPTIDKKAHAWMKNMAASRRRFGRLGEPDVLVTHHFHHEKGSDWGDCLWRQTRSQDRGSPYFEQATGEYSDPGMLTFVMSPSCRYADEMYILGESVQDLDPTFV